MEAALRAELLRVEGLRLINDVFYTTRNASG